MLHSLALVVAASQSLTCMPLAIEPGAHFATSLVSLNTADRNAAMVDFEVNECDSFSVSAELEAHHKWGGASVSTQPVPLVSSVGPHTYRAIVNLADLVGASGCGTDAREPLSGDLKIVVRCADGRTSTSAAVPVQYAYSDTTLFPYAGEGVLFDRIVDAGDGNHLVTFGVQGVAVYDVRRDSGTGAGMDAFRTQLYPVTGGPVAVLRRGRHLQFSQSCLQNERCEPMAITDPRTGATRRVERSHMLSLNLEGESQSLIEGLVTDIPGGVMALAEGPDGRLRAATVVGWANPTRPGVKSQLDLALLAQQDDGSWQADSILNGLQPSWMRGEFTFYRPGDATLVQLVPETLELREIALPDSRPVADWSLAPDAQQFVVQYGTEIFLANPGAPLRKIKSLPEFPDDRASVSWTRDAVAVGERNVRNLQIFDRKSGARRGTYAGSSQLAWLDSDGMNTFVVHWDQGIDLLDGDAHLLTSARLPAACGMRPLTAQVLSQGRLAWLTAAPPWGKTMMHWLDIP